MRAVIRSNVLSARTAQVSRRLAVQRNVTLGRPSTAASTFASRRWASSAAESSTAHDPTLARSVQLLEEGTQHLEQGDLETAVKLYRQSVEVKNSSGGWFNIGVCEYHLNRHAEAIAAWEKSIELEPSSDAYTNLASAYVMAKPPQPALAIKHLTEALKLAPDDPEIAFNLAAILESTENLEPALKLYEKAVKGGIERANQNIRSISAKILAKKASTASSNSTTSSATSTATA